MWCAGAGAVACLWGETPADEASQRGHEVQSSVHRTSVVGPQRLSWAQGRLRRGVWGAHRRFEAGSVGGGPSVHNWANVLRDLLGGVNDNNRGCKLMH